MAFIPNHSPNFSNELCIRLDNVYDSNYPSLVLKTLFSLSRDRSYFRNKTHFYVLPIFELNPFTKQVEIISLWLDFQLEDGTAPRIVRLIEKYVLLSCKLRQCCKKNYKLAVINTVKIIWNTAFHFKIKEVKPPH